MNKPFCDLDLWTHHLENLIITVSPSVGLLSICVWALVKVPSAVQELSSWQDVHVRRCVAWTFDPLSLNRSVSNTPLIQSHMATRIWKFNKTLTFLSVSTYMPSFIEVPRSLSTEISITLNRWEIMCMRMTCFHSLPFPFPSLAMTIFRILEAEKCEYGFMHSKQKLQVTSTTLFIIILHHYH